MNTPRETLGPIQANEHRNVLVIDKPHHYEATIYVDHNGLFGLDEASIVLTKDEAIEMAQNILVAYNVPFCNKVKGAGVAQ
jgi:hypothetical protein